jgi:arabinogalactan endo-1,4-beta-galactosidase
MIDFHYSDSWADPGKQNKPELGKTYLLINWHKPFTTIPLT